MISAQSFHLGTRSDGLMTSPLMRNVGRKVMRRGLLEKEEGHCEQ